MKTIYFDTIPSTNLYLKENNELDNLTIICANHQTQGRGRLGRTWIDNDDLLFSILINKNIDNPTDYTFLIAITILNVLKKLGLNSLIKWPNDIIVNDKKVCGILLESISNNYKIEKIIIGVGLNINTIIFPNDLIIKATSLKLELNKNFDKNELLKLISNEFEINYNLYINNKINLIEIVSNNFYLLNKKVSFIYKNENLIGTVHGIDEFGNIIIESNRNLMHVNSGEITLHDNYK